MPGECKLRTRQYVVGYPSLYHLAKDLAEGTFAPLQKILQQITGGACEYGALIRIGPKTKTGPLMATLQTCSNPANVPQQEPESKSSAFVTPASSCVFLTSVVPCQVKKRFWKEVGVALLTRPEGLPPNNLWVRFVPGRNLTVFY